MFQSLLVSKELLKKINYLDENVISWQEWDTSIQLSKYGNFIHIKQPLFIYNLHNDETISKNMLNYIKGYLYIINKYKYDIIKLYDKNEYNKQIDKMKQKAINCDILNEVDHLLIKA